MKKLFLLTLLCLTFSVLSAQTYRILENDFNKVALNFTAGNLQSVDVTTEGGTFSRVTMDHSHLSTEVGKPQLPVMVNLLEIPLCDEVNYTITDARYRDVSAADLGINYTLFPAQRSYTKSYTGPVEFVKDDETYSQNRFYGNDLIRVEKSGVMRNINIATVYFSPIQYNPVTNTYRVYESVDVEFTFENADIAATYEMKTLHGNAVFNGLQSQVINPIHAANRESTFQRPIKYLIVSHSSFRGSLDSFVTWKKRQGFNVEIVYTDDPNVGTTTTTISNYIKSEYTGATEDNPAPTYVLLVGDIAQIPAFNTQVSGESHVTDLYYFTWTSGDHFPDCYYGRFSAQNTTQLANILEKTLMYEQYTMNDPAYLDDAVLVAGSDANWSTTHANGQMNYLSNNYINTAYGYSNVHLYLYNSSSQAAQIRSDIGAGVGYANYTAHCGSDGWSDPAFNTNHIASMQNEGKYCFMIGNCCLSNKFDDNECFGEAITRVAKKGAVAYIGGSNSTIWDEDFYWSVGVRSTINSSAVYDASHLGAYDRLFHTHGENFSDWYVTGGSILQGGNLSVESASSTYKLYYWEIYHLMGDPSILPWLSQADPMTVTVPEAMVSGSNTLTVNAVPYAYVALTANGEVVAAATADANGDVTLSFDPVTPENTYELAVTAQNYQPFFQTISVILPAGAYVVATDVAVASGDEPNYGATVGLNATLKNLGVDGASNISATLATTSSDVTILNGTTTLSALAANAEQAVTPAFTVQVSDNVVDMSVAHFTITTSFNGTGSTTTNYNLTLKAPSLYNTVVESVETEGNNNGAINPGETCVLRVTTRNAGHAPAVSSYSHIRCAYDQVTIVNDEVSMGDIPASGNFVSEYTIQIGANVPEPFIIPFVQDVYAGNYSFTDTLYLFVGECKEDFETGNFTKFPWSNGNRPWTISTSNPYEGTYCAVSASGLSYGNTSTLSLSITATANDSISFYRRFSAGSSWYGSDSYTFYIDNQAKESLSSATSWGRASFPVSAGTHTIKFEFSREGYGGSSGSAAIDYIKFPMNGQMAPIVIDENVTNILSVYPVPATDFVNIQLPEGKSFTLSLFDINGKKVAHRSIAAGQNVYELNVNELSSGTYIISLFNDENVYTGKIIKK